MDALIKKIGPNEALSTKMKGRKETLDKDVVFQQLKEMIAEVIGDDVASIIGITEKSTFLGDLDMNSIQIVALAEKVRSKYGNRVDVLGWFAKKPIISLLLMNVSDVVKLIVKGV